MLGLTITRSSPRSWTTMSTCKLHVPPDKYTWSYAVAQTCARIYAYIGHQSTRCLRSLTTSPNTVSPSSSTGSPNIESHTLRKARSRRLSLLVSMESRVPARQHWYATVQRILLVILSMWLHMSTRTASSEQEMAHVCVYIISRSTAETR
jgi:hypothetical protein